VKQYTISKRFSLWVNIKITADNFDEAVKKGKELKDEKFFKVHGDYIDGETLDGFGVQEQF